MTSLHRSTSWLLLVLLLPLLVLGCDSSDPDDGDGETELGSGFFRVDGTRYNLALPADSDALSDSLAAFGGFFAATSSSAGFTSLGVIIPNYPSEGGAYRAAGFSTFGVDGPGTYALAPPGFGPDPSTDFGFAFYASCPDVDPEEGCDEDEVDGYAARSTWTLTITEFTEESVAGSFEFTGVSDADSTDTVEVEGEFNLLLGELDAGLE